VLKSDVRTNADADMRITQYASAGESAVAAAIDSTKNTVATAAPAAAAAAAAATAMPAYMPTYLFDGVGMSDNDGEAWPDLTTPSQAAAAAATPTTTTPSSVVVANAGASQAILDHVMSAVRAAAGSDVAQTGAVRELHTWLDTMGATNKSKVRAATPADGWHAAIAAIRAELSPSAAEAHVDLMNASERFFA
jgi:hypothetical protein